MVTSALYFLFKNQKGEKEMTRQQVVDLGPSYRKSLVLHEAVFDAVLDSAFAAHEKQPEESSKEYEARICEEKIQAHTNFVNSILSDIANGNDAVIPADSEYAEYNEMFEHMRDSLKSVKGYPQPRYSLSERANVAHIADVMVHNSDFMQENILFYSDAKHGMSVYGVKMSDFYQRDESGNLTRKAEDNTTKDIAEYGAYQGQYGTQHPKAFRTMCITDAILLMNQYLKENDKMPMTLTECQRIRDFYDNGSSIDLMLNDGSVFEDLKKVYESVHATPEGKDNPIDSETFQVFMKDHGYTMDNLLAKYGRMGTVDSRNTEYGARVEYLDVFGKDKKGNYIANTEIVQTFLNPDKDKQVAFMEDDEFPVFGISPDNMLYIKTSELNSENPHVYFKPSDGFLGDLGERESYIDKCGLSMIKPYIESKAYDEFVSILKVERNLPELDERHERAIKNSIAVFEELDKRGLTYHVETDINAGQLKACVDSPKAEFRVMDLTFPDKVGRSFVSGAAMYYKTEKKHPVNNPRTGRQEWQHDTVFPTEQMTRDLVAYSLGEKVMLPVHDNVSVMSHYDQPDSYVNPENFVGMRGTMYLSGENDNCSIPVTKSVRMSDGSGTKSVSYNATYAGKDRKFTAFYGLEFGKSDKTKAYPVSIYADGTTRNVQIPKNFDTSEDARDYIIKKMDIARNNFKELTLYPILNYEHVLDASGNVLNDSTGRPMVSMVDAKSSEELENIVLSFDPNVRALQENYIKYLTTDNTVLRGMNDIDVSADSLEGLTLFAESSENTSGRDKALDIVMNFDNITEKMFGNYVDSEPDYTTGIALNMAHILQYSDATADEMIMALQALGDDYHVEFLNETGEFSMNRIKEKMVTFDKESSISLLNMASNDEVDSISGSVLTDEQCKFRQHIKDIVSDSLQCHGCDIQDIRMDKNGIIQYSVVADTGMTITSGKDVSSRKEFTGTIGQIFEPDENGVIVTNFNHDDNHAIVPGYTAYVSRRNRDDANHGLESRTILKGYHQILDEQIRASIHANFIRGEFTGMNNTQLNSVYRHLYDTRLPKDYKAYYANMGMGDELMHATIDTLKGAVRYSTELKESSTLNVRLNAKASNVINDCNHDSFSVTERDISILGDSERGYFDMIATSTGTTQGLSRYLVSGANVDEKGHIIPSEDKFDKCPILKLDVCENIDYNPFDRQQMTFSNLMSCFNVEKNSGCAHMTLKGWTMDDGYVVSKEFAENCKVPIDSKHPELGLRPLKVGDKICDLNGNKGVINLVVDREASLEEIQKHLEITKGTKGYQVSYKGEFIDARSLDVTLDESINIQAAKLVQKSMNLNDCDDIIALYALNRDLDVIGAPFTAPSRMNGGTARGMMESAVDLQMPDGSVVKGGMGYIPFIITDMTVDEKTHIYDDEAFFNGKGRKASSQLAWGLQASGAEAIMREFYGDNMDNIRACRERMIALGMDIDENFVIHKGYTPHIVPTTGESEVRPIIELGTLPEHPEDEGKPKKHPEDVKMLREQVSMKLAQTGGFMRIPFPIEYPTGELTPKAPDGDGYLLPVLPVPYRSEQSYDDNTAILHDYTKKYLEIADAALRYQQAQRVGDEDTLTSMKIMAQRSYQEMSSDIQEKSFEGKYNMWKYQIMGNRLPNSATAVWTGDPRLKLNEIAMNSEMMKTLGVKSGDEIMTWRDPLLRKEGIAGLTVVLNESLTGVAINPAMDKRYDGDFDGDSIALVNLRTKEAKAELHEKFSVVNTLIDRGPTPNWANLKDPAQVVIALNTGLDVASANGCFDNKTKQNMDDLLNEVKMNLMKGAQTQNELYNETALNGLNDYIRICFDNAFGSDHICYDTMEHHLKTVDVMVSDHKAKGKTPKLQEYCDYLGVQAEFDRDESGKITHLASDRCTDNLISGIMDRENPENYKKSLDMFCQTEQATAIKSFGTGVAGAFSQRGVKACRDDCILDVIETTYGATQGILQAKHDAKEAEQKYMILKETLPALWRGQAIGEVNGVWKPLCQPDGRPVWNDKSSFVEQYTALSNASNGLNFDLAKDHIEVLGNSLYNEKGRIRNVYKDDVEGACPLDKLAYGGTFQTLVELEGQNLFEGKNADLFKPLYSIVEKPRRFKVNAYAKTQSMVQKTEQAVFDKPVAETKSTVKEAKSATPKTSEVEACMTTGNDMLNRETSDLEAGYEAC